MKIEVTSGRAFVETVCGTILFGILVCLGWHIGEKIWSLF